MISNRIKTLSVVVVIVGIGVFYISTIREGHDWGDDFAYYIMSAKNIAEGVDYKTTSYIYNPPYSAVVRRYPPIFPLLLSPVYKWFGLNLKAMKIEIILIFLVFLFIVFLAFKNDIPFHYLISIIAIIGFDPFFWSFKDSILSDIPFLLFLYLSFFFINKAYTLEKFQILYSIWIGILIYISYGTRSIGVILIPCILIYEIIKFRKPSLFFTKAIIVFLFFMVLQNIFLYNEGGYSSLFRVFSMETYCKACLWNLFSYIKKLSELSSNKIVGIILFLILVSLVSIGYLRRVKERVTIFEIFLPLYLVSIIIWPFTTSQGMRYFIPLMPLYIFYIMVGIERIKKCEVEKALFSMLLLVIVISYIKTYKEIYYGPINEGIGKNETQELFEYIKNETRKEDIFIFKKPGAFSLFTERKASICQENEETLLDCLHKINATYIVAGPFSRGWNFPKLFVKKYSNNFEKTFSNSDFEVYKLISINK